MSCYVNGTDQHFTDYEDNRENFQVLVMNAPLVFALGWLGLLVLAANAGASIPDGLGLTVFFVTLWSLGYLYFRLCRRWPIAGWLGLGFLVGLFGGGYHSSATTFVEREYDDTNCDNYDNYDNCDN
jgi:hypothetical protein